MAEEDPNNLQFLFNLLSPEFRAGAVAVVIAVLRILYDNKEKKWQRIALESLLCGALSYVIVSGFRYFGLPSDMSVFAGGTVGFLGVDFIRAKAQAIVNKKVEKK